MSTILPGLLQNKPCGYCKGYHTGKCPLIKAITYHQDGTVARVEFFDSRAALAGKDSQ